MKKHRILMAKGGLDGHNRGIKVVTRSLRDAGFEVIYTGLHQSPEMIVNAAVQEDVDLIGISILSGAHMAIFPKVLELLKEKGREDTPVFGGGIIPKKDMQKLQEAGVKKLFGPGTPTTEIVEWVKEQV
ncbi:cobalamin B12-binding domain-containing protein [bacterium]|nr:cobalamin B12-binding domain-containing protein [bacterium]